MKSAVLPLPLEQLAVIQAALDAGCAREAVLAEAGLTDESWEEERERWMARLAAAAGRGRLRLESRYFELLGKQRRPAAARAQAARRKVEGAIPVAPTVYLAAIGVPASTAPAPGTAPALPKVAPRSALAGTSMALSDAVRQALPFKGKEAATVAPAPAATELPRVAPRSPLAGTSMALPTLVREALPFKGNDAAPKEAAPPAPAPAAPAPAPAAALPKVAPRSPLAGTSMALPTLAREALPFKTGNAPQAVPPVPAPAASAPAAAPTPEAMARLQGMNLGLYAQICADVRSRPEKVDDIRRHYGLEGPLWAALHGLWAQRFQQDPPLRERWQAQIEQRVARQV